MDAVYDEQTGEKCVGLRGLANQFPVLEGLFGDFDMVERFLASKGSVCVVVGLMPSFLQVEEGSGDRDELRMER